jgi:hypothetical protein
MKVARGIESYLQRSSERFRMVGEIWLSQIVGVVFLLLVLEEIL